ncbi:MAG: hypothetical protein QGH60_15925 [Phycisphaerae bacterium]|jgi:hypothetical protein|nr:hypothetical protein [Phycisphaerae bacterium]
MATGDFDMPGCSASKGRAVFDAPASIIEGGLIRQQIAEIAENPGGRETWSCLDWKGVSFPTGLSLPKQRPTPKVQLSVIGNVISYQ